MPSIIVLMCPSLDRGTWDMVSFICTKVHSQFGPSSATNRSLWATSSRVWRWAQWGWAHTAVRLKTHSHPALVLGAIRMKTISHQGFSASPLAPGRGKPVVLVWLLTSGIALPLDRSWANPTWLLWMLPTDGHLWKRVRTHSWWSAMEGLVS